MERSSPVMFVILSFSNAYILNGLFRIHLSVSFAFVSLRLYVMKSAESLSVSIIYKYGLVPL
jgi:hypothetical protein